MYENAKSVCYSLLPSPYSPFPDRCLPLSYFL